MLQSGQVQILVTGFQLRILEVELRLNMEEMMKIFPLHRGKEQSKSICWIID